MTLDAVTLLQALVREKSFSAEEDGVASVLFAALERAGLRPRRIANNVICEKGSGERGLIFNSHVDTVKVAPGYTRDPWGGEIEGDRLYGLGSTDAKSCIAAMAQAFLEAPDPGDRGRIVFAATAEEETGGKGKGGTGASGLEAIVEDLLPLAGGVVGEPTELHICTGQRGMCKLVLTAQGQAGHASRPWEGKNAIEIAAADIVRLQGLQADMAYTARDSILGPTTLQATLIEGGTASNVIPARCEFQLDIRTTAAFPNERAVEAVKGLVRSDVFVRSDRYRPVETAASDPVVLAAQEALPEAELRPFGGVSDLFFLSRHGVPGILIGPGCGKQSHQADEFVSVAMVRKAAVAYRRLAEAFFAS